MQLAVHVSRFPRDPATIAPVLAATARAADEGGVTTLTLMDHWFQMEPYGGPAEPMLDGYTALGFLAGQTSRVQLGLLVTGVTYRHPGLLAKTVATLDVLSGGRALLGIGAAWYEREHLGLGVPFPPLTERFERLEEALQVCAQLWGPDDGPYAGTHYSLTETVCVPAPLHRPRVLVGGSGERKTLRLVAQYADACNLFATDITEVAHKLEVLDRHCADVGRDPTEVQRTIVVDTDPLADPTAFLSTMQEYAALGVAQVFVSPGGPDPARWVAEVCERVLPDLAALSAT